MCARARESLRERTRITTSSLATAELGGQGVWLCDKAHGRGVEEGLRRAAPPGGAAGVA